MKIYTLSEIEGICKVELPSSYIDWFNSGGPGTGPFSGSDCTLRDLIGINETAQEILNDRFPDAILPEKYFIFSMHQGYVFLFFICDGNNNPPVWLFFEGDKLPPHIISETFTEFIKKGNEDMRKI